MDCSRSSLQWSSYTFLCHSCEHLIFLSCPSSHSTWSLIGSCSQFFKTCGCSWCYCTCVELQSLCIGAVSHQQSLPEAGEELLPQNSGTNRQKTLTNGKFWGTRTKRLSGSALRVIRAGEGLSCSSWHLAAQLKMSRNASLYLWI